jgi:hypothetical protein
MGHTGSEQKHIFLTLKYYKLKIIQVFFLSSDVNALCRHVVFAFQLIGCCCTTVTIDTEFHPPIPAKLQ